VLKALHSSDQCCQSICHALAELVLTAPQVASSGTMQAATREFAELVQSRANSLEGQQACHVYVTQELVSDMKDRLEGSQLADALTPLCEESFLEIGWDWSSNKASTGPVAGMLMSASKIKSALSKIAEKCATDETSSGSASALRVEAMSIDDEPVHEVTTSPSGCPAEAVKPECFTTRWEIEQSFETQDHDNEAEPDFISTVEFDDTGEFIAAATRLGKIHVFRKNPEYDDRSHDPEDTNPMFNKYLQFQSHNAEFDYLKSLEIEERINSVRWCRREAADTQLLLATNDKTIKLWKLKNTQKKRLGIGLVGKNVCQSAESSVQAKERMVFQNGHIYHINSLSLNSDGETFLTSDDLRINLWHTGVNTECFNIVRFQ
jgi:WD40 repeat protein